jgi:hypothetical protein
MTEFARIRRSFRRAAAVAVAIAAFAQAVIADEPRILPAFSPPAAISPPILPARPIAPPPAALAPPANVAPQIKPPPAPPSAGAKSYAVRPPLIDMTEALIAESLPRNYSDARHWEKQKHFTTGLDVDLDGLRLDTARRKKLLNHGTWKRYDVWLPEGQKLVLDVTDVRTFDDGRVSFRVTATGPLGGRVELQQWERGVRLLGISADCEAKVKLTLDVEAALTTKQGTLLPTVAVAPKVTAASAEMTDFRLRRLGDLRGPLAKEIGDAAAPALQEQVRKQNDKIADKINKSIAKRNDDLRVSGDEFLKEQWDKLKDALAKSKTEKSTANLK